MSVVRAIHNLLDANWTVTVTGRTNDVPKPTLVLEKKEAQSRLRSQDTAYVADGGAEEHTPQGFGWTHERVDYVVVVQLRGTDRNADTGLDDGRKRMFGDRSGTSAPDDWAGLTGETKRVILDSRKGFAEFTLVGGALRVEDNSDLMGKNAYRADVFVPLMESGKKIDTSV